MKPVGVLFALPEEAAPFRRRRLEAKRVRIACSGAGMRAAARSAERLAADCKLHCLLICGFAGGLASELRPGDLALSRQVTNDTASPVTYLADSVLLSAAESVRLSGIPVQGGTLLTGERILTRSAEKRALAERTGAIAVDMETWGAVQVAQKHGVPWLAVRAITDSVEADFPLDFNALADADGNVDRGRVVLATIARPWKIPALLRLGARSSLAARNLATFLESFLEQIPG